MKVSEMTPYSRTYKTYAEAVEIATKIGRSYETKRVGRTKKYTLTIHVRPGESDPFVGV